MQLCRNKLKINFSDIEEANAIFIGKVLALFLIKMNGNQ